MVLEDVISTTDMADTDNPCYQHTIPQLQRLSYLLDKVQENTLSYQAEGAFNNKMYLWLFKIVILVGAVKDITGLIISNDDIAGSETQKYALLGTSIIGIIIVSINVISGAYGYQVKKQQFAAAVEQFDLLEDRIRFEMINPDENFNKFCQQLEADIEGIKSQCKYQPSIDIKAKYRKRSNRPANIISSTPPPTITRAANTDSKSRAHNIVYYPNYEAASNRIGGNRNIDNIDDIAIVRTGNETSDMINNTIASIRRSSIATPMHQNNTDSKYQTADSEYARSTPIMRSVPENSVLLDFEEPSINHIGPILNDNKSHNSDHIDIDNLDNLSGSEV